MTANNNDSHQYRDHLLKEAPDLLSLPSTMLILVGLLLFFKTPPGIFRLLLWGFSWAVATQLCNLSEALRPYNQDHPMWHQKPAIKRRSLWIAVLVFNVALLIEFLKLLENSGELLEFIQVYDTHHGIYWLAGISFLAHRFGNAVLPSERENRMARIEAERNKILGELFRQKWSPKAQTNGQPHNESTKPITDATSGVVENIDSDAGTETDAESTKTDASIKTDTDTNYTEVARPADGTKPAKNSNTAMGCTSRSISRLLVLAVASVATVATATAIYHAVVKKNRK